MHPIHCTLRGCHGLRHFEYVSNSLASRAFELPLIEFLSLQLATVDVVSFSLKAEPSSPIFSGQTVSIDLSTVTTEDTFSVSYFSLNRAIAEAIEGG